MFRPTPLILAFATLLALLGSRAALAHSVWLEANPQGPGHVVRFGGHAGVLEDYPAEKLQQVHAYDRQGAELGVVRHDRADGVRLVPEGDAALMTLFFDNGYWSRLDSGRSENRPMDQVPGAVSGVRAVKHHKSILHWNAQASRPLGQAFELVPLADRKPRAGQPLELQVLIDGRNSNTAMLVVNYARSIVDRFNRDWAEAHGTRLPPARIETRVWFNPNLESRWFFLPGIVGMLTLLVTMLVTSLWVAREREQGTFDQLLVTPLRPAEILVGKALPGFIIGIAEATVIMAVTVFWFEVPLVGNLLTLYTGVLLFLLSAVGVGLMISSLAATQQQGLLGAFFFLVPAVLLSGFATPSANMPPLLQDLTLLNPLRYFLVVLRGVFLEGTPFTLLIPQFWPMAAIGVAALAIAGWLFRHRMV
jgi:ABC-2 type transport system permease protein